MSAIDPQCGFPFREHVVAETSAGFVLMCPLKGHGKYTATAGPIGFSGTVVD